MEQVCTRISLVQSSLISNLLVGAYGEAEFIFASIKVITITGLIILGIVLDLGGGPNHDRLGFRYWNNPGAFARAGLVSNLATDRFLAIISTFVQAAFSFQGIELVVIAASETQNPRRNIAKAVRRVFYRILIFYVSCRICSVCHHLTASQILGTIVTGMLVPYTDPDLLQGLSFAQSP